MALVESIRAGDVAAVRSALENGADANEVLPGKSTPLIEAAAIGALEIVKVLLTAGAEPTLKDETQDTAILKAGANGHAAVVQVLSEFASDDERDMAKAFLKSVGHAHAPEFSYTAPSDLQRTAAGVAARAAAFVGHDGAKERLDRVERSEKLKKR